MKVLIELPRPASALPNSSRFVCCATRVGWSNMLKTSSISTGAGCALAIGTVEPFAKPFFDEPSVICTYLRPRADRGRMMMLESMGSFSTVVSSLRSSTAMTRPLFSVFVPIASTTPMREPATRTSLPRTRFAASGTSTLSW